MSTLRRLARFVRDNVGVLAVAIVLTTSLGINVMLANRVRAAMAAAPFADPIGSELSPLRVQSLDGTRSELSFRGSNDKVIYFVSPECSWCERNYANIIELSRAAASRYEFVGLAFGEDVAPMRAYASRRPLPFPSYVTDDLAWLKRAGLIGTPATLVVDEDSTVRERFRGAYTASRKGAIEAFFQVTLPGVTPLRR